MDMILDKSEINCRREIWYGTVRREEMAECVVPDTCPDFVQAALHCAQSVIRGKSAANGKVTVEAAVLCTALCLAESAPELYRMDLEVPFVLTAEVPEADEDTDIIAALELENTEIRLPNPRKLMARAELCVQLRCFNGDMLTVSCTAQAEPGLQLLEKSCVAVTVTDVCEKTFAISDELALPPTEGEYTRILCQHVELKADDVKFVGKRLIFKGEIRIQLLLEHENSPWPICVNTSSSFSQLIELSEEAENAELTLCLTGAYFDLAENDSGKKIVSAEIHILAQAAAFTSREMSYIADAYSNAAECTVSVTACCVPQARTETVLRETYCGTAEAEAAEQILCAAADCTSAAADTNGVTAAVRIQCLYRGADGMMHSAVHSGSLQIAAELPAGPCCVLLHCGEVYAVPSAGGIDLRVPVEAKLLFNSSMEVNCVTGITLTEQTERPERPSIYLIPTPENAQLWELAKKYGSTVQLIESQNPEIKDVLLIPGQRM